MKTLSVLSRFMLIVAFAQSSAYALTVGQVDDFEDGTTQNWVVNLLGLGTPPFPPVNVPSGGPRGTDDNFLLLTATGVDATGGRLSVINFFDQWQGNYIAAGVSAIAMDVNNTGNTDLALRLLIEDPSMAAPPSNVAFSADPILLPAGSGWTRVLFPLDPGLLTASTGSVLNALTGATTMRIFHAINDGFPGTPIATTLGVDNIQAVPEPSAWMIAAMGLGLAGLVFSKKRAPRYH
jgi:hypothetical protein